MKNNNNDIQNAAGANDAEADHINVRVRSFSDLSADEAEEIIREACRQIAACPIGADGLRADPDASSETFITIYKTLLDFRRNANEVGRDWNPETWRQLRRAFEHLDRKAHRTLLAVIARPEREQNILRARAKFRELDMLGTKVRAATHSVIKAEAEANARQRASSNASAN